MIALSALRGGFSEIVIARLDRAISVRLRDAPVKPGHDGSIASLAAMMRAARLGLAG